ncbi:YdeI family protein [Mammaliicoccus sciuri]|uniref:YdeI/OmpD-associated family protein n=1 Tax=Mammaliicoccus sciuri TaxID=1296 RepID=UPI001E392740|nr:YdeI family protein [Mammaliicoccus sciuri]MCD8807814.1 YdeI family protein [Mammaliicoccus sciuri]MCD8893238.1 YdeI family protein [Mammaliicoccus sciuri]MCD8911472.1 YdeI family protein [Mammaliicoccus sciuri]
MESNPKVEAFMQREKKWKDEFERLREIIRECDLEEDYKWMHPCYTLKGKNVVLIHGFKEYCALLFHKGSLLKDPEKILIQQTKNVQAARQLRFTNVDQIKEQRDIIKVYVEEAIELEKSGAKVELKKTEEYEMPVELQEQLDQNSNLKEAFNNLTPGRQRQYIYYISQAKRPATRVSRVEKYIDHILDGKGLNDE